MLVYFSYSHYFWKLAVFCCKFNQILVDDYPVIIYLFYSILYQVSCNLITIFHLFFYYLSFILFLFSHRYFHRRNCDYNEIISDEIVTFTFY